MATTDKKAQMWGHFNRAFKKFDEGFAEAAKGFGSEGIKTADANTVQFKASSWSQRRKLAKCFMKMAAQMLRCGETTIRFKK